MSRLGRNERVKAKAAQAARQPIVHARPVSDILSPMCDLAGSTQRKSFRFHDPLGGVLRARHIFKRPTCKRWSKH